MKLISNPCIFSSESHPHTYTASVVTYLHRYYLVETTKVLWALEQELSIVALKSWERISILTSQGSSQLYLNTGAYQKIKKGKRKAEAEKSRTAEKLETGREKRAEEESIKFMTHTTRKMNKRLQLFYLANLSNQKNE